jgi:hypothetical protein
MSKEFFAKGKAKLAYFVGGKNLFTLNLILQTHKYTQYAPHMKYELIIIK